MRPRRSPRRHRGRSRPLCGLVGFLVHERAKGGNPQHTVGKHLLELARERRLDARGLARR